MTHVDTASMSDPLLLQRVRAAAQPDRTLAAALHDSTAVLGIQLNWHEADVLAEAVRGHHDKEVRVWRVVDPAIGLSRIREMGVQEDMLDELLRDAHKAGMALVAVPVETQYTVGSLRSAGSLAEKKLGLHLMSMYPDRYDVVLLTGKLRSFAKAT
jgi:hypothetical protein